MPLLKQTEVGAIRSTLLKHVRDAFISEEFIEKQWKALNYPSPPDFARALEEYEHFLNLLRGFNMDIHLLPANEHTCMDSLYTRDAAIVCNKGLILCNMGKEQRQNEPLALKETVNGLGLPIHGSITGSGRLEGGDVIWVDERTLAVARSYRTNDEGIRQLRELLGECIDEWMVVPLPHYKGEQDVFHLMSLISPLDKDLALVYSPLMPIPFRETLLDRGFELVEVPEEEFETMGCNVLAVAPRKCIMITGNPKTRQRLEKAGAEVHEFEGKEICAKGAGGPTCMTRPLLRE